MGRSNKKPSKKQTYTTNDIHNDIVSENVGNYEKHPFFVTKAKKAKAFLDRVGLPPQVTVKGNKTSN